MATNRIGRVHVDTGRVDAQPPKQPEAKRHRPFDYEMKGNVTPGSVVWLKQDNGGK